MKFYNILTLLSLLLHLFCYPNKCNGEFCEEMSCQPGTNESSSLIFPIRYPFHINNEQPNSCGIPGFGLNCDKSFGTVLQFPNNMVLRVEGIIYNSEQLFLSDPYDCLPQKLMHLNVTNTPFYRDGITKKFWVYNCSGDVDGDVIDCLSGANYTVISSGYDISGRVDVLSNCEVVKILSVHVTFDIVELSTISAIYLAWNGSLLPPAPKNKVHEDTNNSHIVKFVLIFTGITTVTVFAIFCCCLHWVNRNHSTTTVTTSANTTNPDSAVVPGLDQVTIDSYPIVVVGESGRLIVHEDNTCPICLSDYRRRETLKMLPECLHRFHADCIDEWLRTKGVCPICRVLPPRISSHGRS